MDIKLTLTDRHVEALAKAYHFDPEAGISKEDFVIDRILSFVEEVTASIDLTKAKDAAILVEKGKIDNLEKATGVTL